MPQVPYSPVPDVRPTQEATPGLRVNLPGAAFGTDVAAAIGHVGKAVEGAGNEMFERAKAIQELQNESQARDIGAQAAKAMGERHVAYSSLKGQAAVDGYQGYLEDLDNIRKKFREGLNPMAARHYDADSYSVMNRHIFNGAGHASAEAKSYAINSVQAQEKMDQDQVEHDPQNEDLYNQSIERAKFNTKGVDNDTIGLSPEGVEVRDKQKISAITVARLRGIADSTRPGGGPIAAWEEFQKLEGNLFGSDVGNMRNFLKSKMYIQQTQAEADKITDWMIHPSDRTVKKSEDSMLDDARGLAEKQVPGDAVYRDHMVDAVRTKIVQNEQATKRFDRENLEKVWDAIVRLDIKDPRMIDADPEAKKAYELLPAKEREALPGKIYRYQESKERPYREEAIRRLQGLRQSDPAAFQDVDPTKEPHLSTSQIQQVLGWQKQDRASPYKDPTVTRAFGWLRESRGTMLQSLKIYNRGDNQDEGNRFDTFRGALQQALEAWKSPEGHGKPATATDVIETIGPQLMRDMHKETKRWLPPYMLPEPETKPYFEQEPPEAWKNWFINEAMKGGEQPSKEQIARGWLRKNLNELYSKNKKGDKGGVEE